MLAAGHPTPEIASRLHLEVHSKAEAVAFAFQKRPF